MGKAVEIMRTDGDTTVLVHREPRSASVDIDGSAMFWIGKHTALGLSLPALRWIAGEAQSLLTQAEAAAAEAPAARRARLLREAGAEG